MKNEAIEKLMIHNNEIIPVEAVDFNPTQPSIYEVLRVVNQVPLFIEKHMERLRHSAGFLGFSLEALIPEIVQNITKLIKVNDCPNLNVKLIVYNLQKLKPDYFLYFTHSVYPDTAQYQKGVKTILFHAERHNPNAKVINLTLKEQVTQALLNADAYEALLVNENNQITEGSRSNLFFVKFGKLYTSPGNTVLIGITRVYIFEICARLGIEIIEAPISTDWLKDADGLFLTGTSPKILPISMIDHTHYDSTQDPVIKKLMAAYEKDISDYVASYRI